MGTTDPGLRHHRDPNGTRFMALVIVVAALLVVAGALGVLLAFL